jgi:hypothetical protein
MVKPIADISLRKAAIISGISILIMTIAAAVATDFTIGSLVVKNDPAATLKKITASEMLFRFGVLSWIVTLLCDVLASWGLYIFLKPVNKELSLLMAWFRIVYVAILGAALLNYVNVLSLVNNAKLASAFDGDQLQSQVMLFINGFSDTWSIGLIVFGFHILLLGYLGFKSGYIPKIFGVLLIIASAGYVITNLGKLLLPDYDNYRTTLVLIFIAPMLSEVALGLWLLIKGGKVT